MLIIHGITGGIGRGLYEQASDDNVYRGEMGSLFGTTRQDVDMSNSDSITRFYENMDGFNASLAPIFVINATGVCENALIKDIPDVQYRRQISVTVDGNFFLARAFARATLNRPGSSLLLLSSVVPRLGIAGTSIYSLAKGAIAGLVRSVGPELARNGSRINAIEMGYFDTGIISMVPDMIQEDIKRRTPLRRFGKVEDLWQMAQATLTNRFLTSSILPLTGGL